MTDLENKTLGRLLESMGEMRGEMRAIATTQKVHSDEVHRLRVAIEAHANAWQTQGQRLTNLEENCRRQHRNDTDEHEKAAGLAARVEIVEQHLAELEPRFDETETSVVEVRTEAQVLKESRDRLWKRIAMLAGLVGGSGAIGAVIQYLTRGGN